MSRWEVRLCIDDFDKSKIIRDNTFSLVEVKNKSFRIRDYEKDIKYICKSIDNRLEDWDGKPSLQVAKERLNSISNIFLFYHSLESSYWLVLVYRIYDSRLDYYLTQTSNKK